MADLVKVNTAFDITVEVDDVCHALACGDSLAKYCKDRSLSFGEVLTWIKGDADRHAKYRMAQELRREWMAQTLCDTILAIARFDPGQVYDSMGQVKPIYDWPPECRAALQSFDFDMRDQTLKVKLIDRLRAMELVGKTLGIFAEKVKVEGEVTLADLVTQAAKDGYGKKNAAGGDPK